MLTNMPVGRVRRIPHEMDSSIVIGKLKPDKVIALHFLASIPPNTDGKCFAVPLSMIFPAFDNQVHTVGTVSSSPGVVQWNVQAGIRDIDKVFLKRPRLILHAQQTQTDIAAKYVAHVAQICERFKKHSHPNIVSYFGVLHDGAGRICGLCFLKYKYNLEERVKSSRKPLNKEAFLDGVRQGMEFLHGLGLPYNDIHPTNIRMGADDVPVLNNFSMALEIGQSLQGRYRPGMGQWSTHPLLSCVENDYFAFEKLVKYLNDKVLT